MWILSRVARSWMLSTALSLSVLAPAVMAAPQPVSLSALGGVRFAIPELREVQNQPSMLIFEQLPDAAQKRPFFLLIASVEEAPAGQLDDNAWEQIRTNIQRTASSEGRLLKLELGAEAEAPVGFQSRIMRGNYDSERGQEMAIELIVLVKDERLVTFSLMTPAMTQELRNQLSAVVRSVKLGR